MQKLKSVFYNLSILKKLLLLLITASLLPLTVISLYSYVSNKTQLMDQSYDNMNRMNQQINNNIENQLDIFRQISGMLYTNATLRAYLTREYSRDIEFVEAYSYINDLFYGLMAANSNVEGITVYVSNDTFPTDGVFIKHLSSSGSTPSWIRELDASYGNDVYSTTRTENGHRVFSIARIMNFNSLNYPYGVLCVTIREDYLYSFLKEESIQKDIFIVNETGEILSTRDKAAIGQNLYTYAGIALPPNQSDGILKPNGNNGDALIVFNSMKQGWKTVSLVSLDHILHDARSAAGRILLISAASFLLALIMIILFSEYFSRRFGNLMKQIRLVEAANFNAQITITGNDEVGQLSLAFNRMTRQLGILINELYRKELLRKNTELYALQSQINPHFLYNTLAVISSLAIRKGDLEISEIVRHLSRFYKTSLNKGKRYITIADELDITRHYLAIQHMRFADLFCETFFVDEALLSCQTLKLILQPFIENAINHAVCESSNPLHILIRVYGRENKIHLEIEDDGAGIPAQRLQDILAFQPEAGYGIYNVNERIRLAYGDEYGVFIESRYGEGTKVTLTVPSV